MKLPPVKECDNIPDNQAEIPTPDVVHHHPHLHDIAHQLTEHDSSMKIMLLIGRDLPGLTTFSNKRKDLRVHLLYNVHRSAGLSLATLTEQSLATWAKPIEVPTPVSSDEDSDYSLIQPAGEVEVRSNNLTLRMLNRMVLVFFSNWNRLNFALATVRKFTQHHLNVKRSYGSKNMDNIELLHNTEQLVLKEKSNVLQSDIIDVDNVDQKDLLRKQWKSVAVIFWKRWKVEYLNVLQNHRKWTSVERNVSLGDVVVVRDKELSRKSWPMGIISKVMPSDDGLVRKVEIRRIVDSNPKSFLHPISEVVLLVEQ
ncbi:unnamed protein product [Mytilus coruscus]|uniref:DUF5641 domain-containing protein n=1 Tax=Mytilus coruscus TaxID=42192 RepID=A0A6J8E6M5_MYTCO|nr:unnamed protein product [Mytilus coruscus]